MQCQSAALKSFALKPQKTELSVEKKIKLAYRRAQLNGQFSFSNPTVNLVASSSFEDHNFRIEISEQLRAVKIIKFNEKHNTYS